MMSKILFAAAVVLLAASAPAIAGDPAAGKQKAQPCAACHGPDGNSVASDFPRLAGQHYDYLVHSMKAYKDGGRKNPIMAPQVEKLTVRDIEDLAAYFSEQKGLVVPTHPLMVRH